MNENPSEFQRDVNCFLVYLESVVDRNKSNEERVDVPEDNEISVTCKHVNVQKLSVVVSYNSSPVVNFKSNLKIDVSSNFTNYTVDS